MKDNPVEEGGVENEHVKEGEEKEEVELEEPEEEQEKEKNSSSSEEDGEVEDNEPDYDPWNPLQHFIEEDGMNFDKATESAGEKWKFLLKCIMTDFSYLLY